MVVKFFKTQKGGSSASIDYLLNERVKQGTARILKGDEKVARARSENERNTNFTENYVRSARNFKSDIRNTIQEFGRKFSEYIKTKLTKLREQSKRDIEMQSH